MDKPVTPSQDLQVLREALEGFLGADPGLTADQLADRFHAEVEASRVQYRDTIERLKAPLRAPRQTTMHLHNQSVPELTLRINERLADGWRLEGPLIYAQGTSGTAGTWHQRLIRELP